MCHFCSCTIAFHANFDPYYSATPALSVLAYPQQFRVVSAASGTRGYSWSTTDMLNFSRILLWISNSSRPPSSWIVLSCSIAPILNGCRALDPFFICVARVRSRTGSSHSVVGCWYQQQLLFWSTVVPKTRILRVTSHTLWLAYLGGSGSWGAGAAHSRRSSPLTWFYRRVVGFWPFIGILSVRFNLFKCGCWRVDGAWGCVGAGWLWTGCVGASRGCWYSWGFPCRGWGVA